MSADLVAAIRARLDELEQIARAATPGPWRWADPGNRRSKSALVSDWSPGHGLRIVVSAVGDGPDYRDAEHIAAHDPAAVLRRVAADRRILTEIERALSYPANLPMVHRAKSILDALADGLGIDVETT